MKGLRLAVVASFALTACSGTPEATARRPVPGNGYNVVFITIDTLRADHLGCYGYHRATSPAIDALARQGTVFDQAYTYWPKTRASMVMMLTGRRPSQNGYSHQNPTLLDFNPTLASELQKAGYRTAAVVDNANLAKALGYAKGFDSYREIWEERQDEWRSTQAITAGASRFLRQVSADRPFLLWLHYTNPHAPYTPPPPYDRRFLDHEAESGSMLPIVPDYRGGIPKKLFVKGRQRAGYYVSQYDGEIAAVDGEVGQVLDALRQSGQWDRTVIALTSDHGESLGEHDYYFDHGQDLFDPCLRVPLVMVVPGGRPGRRSSALASTLDMVPTILDALKLPYPPDLAGQSLLPVAKGGAEPRRDRLFAQNDRNLTGALDERHKLVVLDSDSGSGFSLYDRQSDPAELHDLAARQSEQLRQWRREVDLYREAMDREWGRTRKLVAGAAPVEKISPEACERLRALGYVDHCRP